MYILTAINRLFLKANMWFKLHSKLNADDTLCNADICVKKKSNLMIVEIFKTCSHEGKLFHLWMDGSLTATGYHHYVNLEDAPQEVADWVNSQEASYKFNLEKGCWEFTGFVHVGHSLYTVFNCVATYAELCVATYNGQKTISFQK